MLSGVLRAIVLMAVTCTCAVAQIATSAMPSAERSQTPQTTLDKLLRLTESAERALASDDDKEAERLLAAVRSSSAFEQLDENRRHFVLLSSGELASARADFSLAHRVYRQSTTLQSAGSDDWMGRLNAAWFIGDLDDAVASLEKIAHDWPDELAYVSQWAVEALLGHASSTAAQTEYALLEALFDSGWQTDLGLEPSRLWMRLIERHATDGSIERALDVASRVRDPMAIVTLRADRRFAKLVAAAPDWFSVSEAAAAAIIEARLAVEDHPDLLAPAVTLTEMLLQAGRPQDALLVIDTHLARSALKTVVGASFEDAVTESVHALTAKALALIALERWDEAKTQLSLAAEQTLPHDRTGDFHSVALLQARLGEPDAALTTLRKATQRAADPQAELVRFIAAKASSDAAAAEAALAALRAADDSAAAQAQRALLVAGRLDEAAELLIRRLNDPVQRSRALLEIQGMQEQRWPEAALDWQMQAAQLMLRDDVRRSVAASGAIVGDYALYRWN